MATRVSVFTTQKSMRIIWVLTFMEIIRAVVAASIVR